MCFGFFFFSFLGKKKWIGLYFPQFFFFHQTYFAYLYINYYFFFFLLCFLPKKKKEIWLFYSQLDFIYFPKTCSAHIVFYLYICFCPHMLSSAFSWKILVTVCTHCWAKDVGTGLTNLCSHKHTHTPNYLCLVLSILIWTHTSRCIL